jgi:ribosomal protein L37E
MGNDLKQEILVQNGIITEVDAKPKLTVADCARCRLVNPLENKYCSSCGYPLSVAAYEELKAADSKELREVKSEMQHLRWWVDDTLENIAKYTESKDPGYAENLRWHREMMFCNKEKEERDAIDAAAVYDAGGGGNIEK